MGHSKQNDSHARARSDWITGRTSTTLADLFLPSLFADLSSAVWTSLRSWLDDEFDDGVAYGRRARLRRWTVDSFFSPRSCETAILEECVSDHGHERMTMEALPGSSLEVIKPEFLFQLLMSPFANPSGFECCQLTCADSSWPVDWRDNISSLPTSCVRR
jgi:hypothetical protein